MLTVKQKLMYSEFKKLYNKIHKKETVFSMSYCKELVKVTVSKIYEIYPDRNVGKITVNWFDKKYNKTAEIDSETYCFEINFLDNSHIITIY